MDSPENKVSDIAAEATTALVNQECSSREYKASGQDSKCDPLRNEEVLYHVEPSDEVIVKRVLKGEIEAFRVLVERYQPMCTRYAARWLGDDYADAEDVVQDTFLRVFKALSGYEHRGQFKAWLFRILVNQCRTAGGKRALRLKRHVPLADDSATLPGEEENLLWNMTVSNAVARLVPSRREAFLLKYVEELSYEEISIASGKSVSALKMRVKRACDDLKELIKADRNG